MRALVSMPRSPTRHTRVSPNRCLELADLGGQGLGVGGVAVEHLDGHRHPGGRAQQPVDDLQPAFDPVAGVPDRPQRAGAALERRRGHVIEHQRAVGQMPCGQGVFDGVFAGQHPVHRRIQVVLITAGHPEHLPQRAGGGLGAQPARGGQLGARARSPGPSAWRSPDPAAATAPGRSARRSPVARAVPSTAATCPCGRLRVISNASDSSTRRRQPFERPRQRLDLVLGPVRQVGQGAVLHLAALAVAFPQQDRRR